MDCEAADLILEVYELGLAGLVIIGDARLVELEAHSLEVCHSAVNEVGTDTDVTVSTGSSLAHELECLACEDGLAGRTVGHTEHKLEELSRLSTQLQIFFIF